MNVPNPFFPVSLDPSLATDTDGTTADLEMAAVSAAAQFEKQVRLAKSPPPSLVPRLHALVHRRLPHSHPSLPAELPQHSASLQEDAARCRAELHSLLTKVRHFTNLLVVSLRFRKI